MPLHRNRAARYDTDADIISLESQARQKIGTAPPTTEYPGHDLRKGSTPKHHLGSQKGTRPISLPPFPPFTSLPPPLPNRPPRSRPPPLPHATPYLVGSRVLHRHAHQPPIARPDSHILRRGGGGGLVRPLCPPLPIPSRGAQLLGQPAGNVIKVRARRVHPRRPPTAGRRGRGGRRGAAAGGHGGGGQPAADRSRRRGPQAHAPPDGRRAKGGGSTHGGVRGGVGLAGRRRGASTRIERRGGGGEGGMRGLPRGGRDRTRRVVRDTGRRNTHARELACVGERDGKRGGRRTPPNQARGGGDTGGRWREHKRHGIGGVGAGEDRGEGPPASPCV